MKIQNASATPSKSNQMRNIIPYDGRLGTSPLNHGKLTIENPKSNAGMNVTANNFNI